MNILQVSHRVPYPLNEGGTIGIYNYTRGFAEAGHKVTLAALNGIKHGINEEEAKNELKKYCTPYFFPIDTNIRVLDAFLNLFTSRSYNVSRFYHEPFERFLAELLQKETYDIIQVEGTFVAIYLPVLRRYSKAPIVLRQHNVEYQIWERLARNEGNPVKKWYLNLLYKRLKAFEGKHMNQFDALVPVTEDDRDLFKSLGCSIPVFVSPAGIDTNYWKPSEQNTDPFAIYHLGSLEWMPNVEAVEWFIQNVWPLVHGSDPRYHLYIAGKGMPEEMKQRQVPGVTMCGEVADGAEFIADKSIQVVPLLSGSGIRLKILEAMAAGKLVISTTVGAQGIECTPGKDILIADSPAEFATLFSEMSANPERFDPVKKQGYQLIREKYSNASVVNRLLGFYNTLIS